MTIKRAIEVLAIGNGEWRDEAVGVVAAALNKGRGYDLSALCDWVMGREAHISDTLDLIRSDLADFLGEGEQ